MRRAVIHLRSIGLRSAGIGFPKCCAAARPIDLDKSRWHTTGNIDEVTCKRCIRAARSQS